MANPMPANQLLKKAASILPISYDDLVYKGVVTGVSERLFILKKRSGQLAKKYGSVKRLEAKTRSEESTPDDHTLYTDLLEWRALKHEMRQLLVIFEDI